MPALPEEATRLADLAGHPWPRQLTLTRAPTEASTVSIRRRTPEDVRDVRMRTIGNGCIRADAGEATGIVCVATLVSPAAAPPRSRTTWLPGVVNVVLSTGPPGWNTPFPARSQAKDVRGLPGSLEL